MKSKSALCLAVTAGIAASATAKNVPAPVPTKKAGVLYINMETGERSLTRYDEGTTPIVDLSQPAGTLFEYWSVMRENPCWDDPRADGSGLPGDTPGDASAPSTGPMNPWVMFDFGDMPFDSKITGVVMVSVTTRGETVDSNGDGALDASIDMVGAYFDQQTERSYVLVNGRDGFGGSTNVLTAAVRTQSIPGDRGTLAGDNTIDDYDIVLDFGNNHFEMADSDGQDLGALRAPGALQGLDDSTLIYTPITATTPTPSTGVSTIVVSTTTAPNPSPDGLADFQYMQYYVEYNSNDKILTDSVFFGVGAPDGTNSISSFTTTVFSTTTTTGTLTNQFTSIATITTNILNVGSTLPVAQGIVESFGWGTVKNADVPGDPPQLDRVWNWDGNDGIVSFGGYFCQGFLQQLVEEPVGNNSYYAWTPFSQFNVGFFSDQPPNFDCLDIDFNPDGFIENADIGAYIALFFAQDPAADINGDTFIENGDISAFVALFLSCVG